MGGKEEVDVDQELAQELEAAKRCAAEGLSGSEHSLVLKVQCKHGSVQIRQGKTANFEELLGKFEKYAVKKGWCTAKQKCILQFDGDSVEVLEDTPETLSIDSGEVLDVIIK
jgi:TPP-dependent indolepyruvate ferredoxin oxidoreductase alpha subunit